ncbi:MAG: alpha/beta hydrolase [Acidimicrobiia bacterium]|nr:alpha/beta hydrolase [Acidimicrobiia bacterium]
MGLTTYRITREGAERLLFLLHGYSAEQHHLAAYVPLVDPDERFSAICARALHDLDDGDGASWYERSPNGPDPAGFRAALDAVEALIEAERAAAGVAVEQCVLGGFSQGGFLALALAGRLGAPRYGGVWAMCCGLPMVDGVPLDLAAGAGTRALIQYGSRDPIIAPARAHAAAAAFGECGWNVTINGYDMAHSQVIEMMVDARTWLAGLD